MTSEDHKPQNPTRIASACGLSWNRTNCGDVLTWDQLLDLAEERYRTNRARRLAGELA